MKEEVRPDSYYFILQVLSIISTEEKEREYYYDESGVVGLCCSCLSISANVMAGRPRISGYFQYQAVISAPFPSPPSDVSFCNITSQLEERGASL